MAGLYSKDFGSFDANFVNVYLSATGVLFTSGLSLSFTDLKELLIRLCVGILIGIILAVIGSLIFQKNIVEILDYKNDKWVRFIVFGFIVGAFSRTVSIAHSIITRFLNRL